MSTPYTTKEMTLFHLNTSTAWLSENPTTGSIPIQISQQFADDWNMYIKKATTFIVNSKDITDRYGTKDTILNELAHAALKLYDELKTATPAQFTQFTQFTQLMPLLWQWLGDTISAANTITSIIVSMARDISGKIEITFKLHAKYPKLSALWYYMAEAIDISQAGGCSGEGWYALQPDLYVKAANGRISMSNEYYCKSRKEALRMLNDVLEQTRDSSKLHRLATKLHRQISAEMMVVNIAKHNSTISFNIKATAPPPVRVKIQKPCAGCGNLTGKKCRCCQRAYCQVTCQKAGHRRASPATPACTTLALLGCILCGNSSSVLLTCSRCLAVHYCGTKCQKCHWGAHKPNCHPPN